MTHKVKITQAWGDTHEVYWAGDVWVSPSNQQRYARAEDAMRVELEHCVRASGEDPDNPRIASEIAAALTRITYP